MLLSESSIIQAHTEISMTVTSTPPAVTKRYPSLRFLTGVYKFIGALILVGGFFFGLSQMTSGSFGVMVGFSTIVSSLFMAGMCGLIAEGVEVFLGIEENTRQATLIAAQSATTSPVQADMRQMAATLAVATRLLEQVSINQQQTTQRLDTLTIGLDEVRGGIGTGVKSIESIAESSKATATLLYRNGAKPS